MKKYIISFLIIITSLILVNISNSQNIEEKLDRSFFSLFPNVVKQDPFSEKNKRVVQSTDKLDLILNKLDLMLERMNVKESSEKWYPSIWYKDVERNVLWRYNEKGEIETKKTDNFIPSHLLEFNNIRSMDCVGGT